MDAETTRQLKELIEGMEKEQDRIDAKSKTGPTKKKARIAIGAEARNLDKADYETVLETQAAPASKNTTD
jgi:hypothetical protein